MVGLLFGGHPMITTYIPTYADKPRKRRSNDYPTREAIKNIVRYLQGCQEPSIQGSYTLVELNEDDSIALSISGRVILRIRRKGLHPVQFSIYSSDLCDQNGNLIRQAREMLNGIFDEFCQLGLLPDRVRIWLADRDTDHEMAYLVNNDNKYIFNRDYCDLISIKFRPDELEVLELRGIHNI